MFTGIIEELGSVQTLSRGRESAKICISATFVVQDVKLGDSIAVNGVCLTVVAFDAATFTAEAMAETLDKTVLGNLRTGEKVNLERALRLSDRLGGHLVSGHVDGVGTIRRQTSRDIAVITEISYPPNLRKYLAPKGSIAIDGVSLTLVGVEEDSFSVSLIPHSRSKTTLGIKRAGDKVNLEADLLARYLENLLRAGETGRGGEKLTPAFLAEHGFI